MGDRWVKAWLGLPKSSARSKQDLYAGDGMRCGLWPDDPPVAHWTGGMRGVRGVNMHGAVFHSTVAHSLKFAACERSGVWPLLG